MSHIRVIGLFAALCLAGILPAQAQTAPNCNFPAPSSNAQIVLLSAYEAQGLSTSTITSQDVAVHTGSIAIAPGARPLYIVVETFRPTIWRFTGAIDRVEHASLLSTAPLPGAVARKDVYRPQTGGDRGTRAAGFDSTAAVAPAPGPVGATGLATPRITFLADRRCGRYFTDPVSIAGAMAAGALRASIGRAPDMMAARYGVSAFSIGATDAQAADSPYVPVFQKTIGSILSGAIIIDDGELASDVNRFYPAGIVPIDPKTVTANGPVARYDVLPNQAGLQQLVKQGVLTRANGEFQIHRKMRFPAELTGAQAARFLLLKGVPPPDGDPGHSCLVSQDTGQVLANSALCPH